MKNSYQSQIYSKNSFCHVTESREVQTYLCMITPTTLAGAQARESWSDLQWYNEIDGWLVLKQKAADAKYLLFNPVKRFQLLRPNESCGAWKRRLRRPISYCMRIHEDSFLERFDIDVQLFSYYWFRRLFEKHPSANIIDCDILCEDTREEALRFCVFHTQKPRMEDTLAWIQEELPPRDDILAFVQKYLELAGGVVKDLLSQKMRCLALYNMHTGSNYTKESQLAPADLTLFQRAWNPEAPARCPRCAFAVDMPGRCCSQACAEAKESTLWKRRRRTASSNIVRRTCATPQCNGTVEGTFRKTFCEDCLFPHRPPDRDSRRAIECFDALERCEGVALCNRVKIIGNQRAGLLKAHPKRKPDAFNEDTNTVYLFHGNWYHGYPPGHPKACMICAGKKSAHVLYEKTMQAMDIYAEEGFHVIYIWEHEYVYAAKHGLPVKCSARIHSVGERPRDSVGICTQDP